MRPFLNEQNRPRILICCGSGGVGKTTLSATLGLKGALLGHKTIVLTIDPAKRLADSLGLTAFKTEVQQVPLEKFHALGLFPAGELHAMMLDPKKTFDQLIIRHASPDLQRKILDNRYYQHLSSTLLGSHEYMAMEKLYEIFKSGHYDLIILDTPPSRRALDFLDAPQNLLDVLGHHFFWKLFAPYYHAGKWSMRIVSSLSSPFIKAMDHVLGQDVLKDVIDFFGLWNDILFDGFRKRAKSVKQLLESSDALFFAITSPMHSPMNEAIFLYRRMQELNLHFGGFIVNRVHPAYQGTSAEPFGSNSDLPALNHKLVANFKNFQKIGSSDHASVEQLRHTVAGQTDIRVIHYFEKDVYDFNDLLKIARQLFSQQ